MAVRVGGAVGGRECGWEGVGQGLVWKWLMLLPAAPARRSKKKRSQRKKTTMHNLVITRGGKQTHVRENPGRVDNAGCVVVVL